jgi:hypothetical protein
MSDPKDLLSLALIKTIDEQKTELTAVRLELEKAKAVRNDRERRRSKAEAENRRLTAMLDRIARVVSDRFDPKSEECIADGVDSLVDELATLKKERDEARDQVAKVEQEHADADNLCRYWQNLYYVAARERETLQKAVRLTLDENAHLADGENCTLIRLKNALTPTPPQGCESEPSCGTCVRICGIRDLGEPCKDWTPKEAV